MSTSLLVNYLAYLAAGTGLWALSVVLYVHITPMREFELVRRGNVAAALSLSGAALGLALPIGSLAVHAVNLIDMVLWSVISLAAQVLFYIVAGRARTALAAAIEADNRAVGMVAGVFAVCVGAISACCLSY